MDSSLFSVVSRLRIIAVGSHHRFSWTARSYCSGSFYRRIRPLGNPNVSLVPKLDKWVNTGRKVQVSELQHIIRDLRKRRRFSQALEVSEWMTNRGVCVLSPGGHAVQLDLIGKVHGLASAERYFNSMEEEKRSEKIYGALLNCYVRECLAEKSLLHMQKMKELGYASSPLPYNNIMSLYTNLGHHEQVPHVLTEMKENGVLPNNFSYRICINSYCTRSDLEEMEKLLKEMTQQPYIIMDWNTYTITANFYIKAGLNQKAIASLQKSEALLIEKPNGEGFNHLVSLYGNLGNKSEVLRIKEVQRLACKRLINRDYWTILEALVKLGDLEEAESLLGEWESSGNSYDFRVPNVLLIGYCHQGSVEKAEMMLEEIAKKGRKPIPNSFGILASFYVDKGELRKAVDHMKNALSVFPGNEGWSPNPKVVTSVMDWLGDEGDTAEVEAFVGSLSTVIPMNREMYQALIKANIRGGKEVDGILKSMEADKVEVNEETKNILENFVKRGS